MDVQYPYYHASHFIDGGPQRAVYCSPQFLLARANKLVLFIFWLTASQFKAGFQRCYVSPVNIFLKSVGLQ